MKRLPTSEYNFRELIINNNYYVDKTKVIGELLSKGSKVNLFPRPRRFGKSLLMSMLNNFFEIDLKVANKDLFEGLYISKSPYYKCLSKYPVINLDFKSLKNSTYESTYNQFKIIMSDVYQKKSYIYDTLTNDDKEIFDLIVSRKASLDDYKMSIKYLSKWLNNYYKENEDDNEAKVIVLIDEYDTAINESYIQGYYKELMDLIQPVLSNTFKGNDSLKIGVLTGVLKVGGESLFSDFNNLKIYDIMSEQYNEYFGFTKEETKELLEYYGLEKNDEVKEYYDGYNFGGLHIYNPFSIINYADEKKLRHYWINTGSNKLLKDLLSKISNKELIEKLIQGESITFNYDNSITYESFTTPDNLNNLLNLLLVTGYITFDYEEEDAFGNIKYFRVPNKEVKEELNKIVSNITFKEELFSFDKYKNFMLAFFNGDKEYIEYFINNILPSMSYHDYYETFYHGYSLGLFSILLNNKNFIVKSNRETGTGRLDIMLEKTDKTSGVVIEFKVADDEEDLEEKAIEGLNQIKEKEYYKELLLDKIENIYEIVIVYNKKKCIVR